MVKTIFVIALNILLVSLLAISLYNFNQFYFTMNNLMLKVGFGVIITFTFLITFRYMLLLFFSLLRTLQKTSDEDENIDYNFLPKVTIVVPAYNEDIVISSSIKSLISQTYPNLEIIIVDDGSSDNTYLIAKRFEFIRGNKSLKVHTKKNGGKSRAINYGINASAGELILVVDADSKLNKNATHLLVQHFKNEDTAAVAGSVYITNQNNLLTKLQALEYIEGLNMVRNGQAFLKAVNIIPGPIGMFRKKALYEVGLYDHDTFAEDCDVTLKLIAKGYKIDFEPDAVSFTEAPESLLNLIKQRYRWTRGILQAIRKHSRLLFHFRENITASFVLWYMLFEAVFWPFADIWVNLFILYTSFSQGASILIFYWWTIFSILDITGALYCVLITGEKISLVFYAVLYRLGFIQIINIAKVLSTIEEFFGIEMTWGKLERKGAL